MWISICKILIQFLSEPDEIDIDANDNKNFVFKLEIWFIHSWDHPAVYIRWKKKSNPRKMAKLQLQVKHFVAYTRVASQFTNFEWKADN